MYVVTPFFSIIIPVYNRARRLPYVLESLKKQTFQDFETIIVDDASTDDSYQVALDFDLQNKIVLRNEKNSERCVTRNKGIDVAHGEYICFLDSDDYHLPNHLQVLHDYIVEKDCPKGFFFTNAWDETENRERTLRCCPTFSEYNPFVYFLRYTVNPQRWAIHRSILQNLQFDENVVIAEDMDLSLRIVAEKIPVYQIEQPTTIYVAALDSFTHGDSCKAEKELFYFKRIFSKKELKPFLPRKEINRLLSQCYFHIMEKAFVSQQRWQTIVNGLKSFFLCPAGYNRNTNKIVFVSCLYSLPILGYLCKKIRSCK